MDELANLIGWVVIIVAVLAIFGKLMEDDREEKLQKLNAEIAISNEKWQLITITWVIAINKIHWKNKEHHIAKNISSFSRLNVRWFYERAHSSNYGGILVDSMEHLLKIYTNLDRLTEFNKAIQLINDYGSPLILINDHVEIAIEKEEAEKKLKL